MLPSSAAPLPIDAVAARVRQQLRGANSLVLTAPPGAGKTTRLPLLLRDEEWLGGRKLIVVEPRRLAARAAARHVAGLLGEPVGATVGYRVRLDTRIGPATRIEFVTHGVFIRLLQADPGLGAIGGVLFDEFHERNLDADLAFALCLDAQQGLRPDLRLVVMSATLAVAPVAALLGGAPVIETETQAFAVALRWLEKPPPARFEDAVAGAVSRALAADPGDVLVFLPGAREIRRVAARLADARGEAVRVLPLHGDLPLAEQDRALAPAAGVRKIVLATSIAETSLTIPGVRIVVDGGYRRAARFDPGSGLTHLVTVPVSQAAAAQRAGRAGREAAGVCWRLWREAEHRALLAFEPPEILSADLAPLALELAQWGVADAGSLAWPTTPPAARLAEARQLLQALGALDAAGRITPHGRRLAGFGTHPRLGHMMLEAARYGLAAPAAAIAALLGERDLLRGEAARDPDLRHRLELVENSASTAVAERGALARIRAEAGQWRRALHQPQTAPAPGTAADAVGVLLALAYPDRIARRRGAEPGEFLLANGRGAVLDAAAPLAAEPFLAVAVLDGDRRRARIRLAAPMSKAALDALYPERIEETVEIAWDSRAEAVVARRRRRLGALVLDEEPVAEPGGERVTAEMLRGIRELGLAALPWTEAARQLQARIGFLRRVEGKAAWPAVDDEALAASLETWLAPYLAGITRRSQLARLDLAAALSECLTPAQRRRLETAAPTHVTVPSGSRLPLDYTAGEAPVLPVRLQEMFGARDGPRVADGRAALLLQLLSPGFRPVQVTGDLAGFWAGSYRQVRNELRGRYPKHAWPEDPLAAPPLRGAKPRLPPARQRG